jgi:KDO2-lipid IV(A) lauroyltransferase
MNERSLEAATGALIAVARILSRWPRSRMLKMARCFGLMVYALVARRRRVALTNLAIAFPELSLAQHRAIARQHMKAFIVSLVDRFSLWEGPIDDLDRMIRVSGWSYVDAARESGPVIVLAPHFLGLDAGGLYLSSKLPVVSVYAQQKSQTLTEAMTSGRARFPDTSLVLRNEGLRAVLRHLKQGKVLYLLPDMDLGARDAVFVPFFGLDAATVTTLSRLARMTGAQVLPTVTRLQADHYHFEIFPAWTDLGALTPEASARRMNAFIEARVREDPHQYLWTHRRYKTRPPGEQPVYR